MRRKIAAVFVSFGLATPALTAASASAAPVVGHVHVAGGNSGWASAEYLASDPELADRLGVTVVPNDGRVGPQDADNCREDVCINVLGDNEQVTHWETTAYGNEGCIRATFYWVYYGTDGVSDGEEESPTICPDSSGPGVYYSGVGPTGYYRHGTHLCSYWDIIPGAPCVQSRR